MMYTRYCQYNSEGMVMGNKIHWLLRCCNQSINRSLFCACIPPQKMEIATA